MTEKELLIQKLKLQPHQEGGYFSEIHRSEDVMKTDREGEDRSFVTSC